MMLGLGLGLGLGSGLGLVLGSGAIHLSQMNVMCPSLKRHSTNLTLTLTPDLTLTHPNRSKKK